MQTRGLTDEEFLAMFEDGGHQDQRSTPSNVARVPWREHFAELHRAWRPGQHLSVLGQNGSGKTHLIRWDLELWADSRVWVIDTKGDDPEWRHGFRTVHDVPSWLDRGWQNANGGRDWWRIVPSGDRAKRRSVVAHVLRSAMRHGNIVLVIDEVRALAGKPPNLHLDEDLHEIWQRGRSRRVTLIAGAQSPVYLPSGFYDEARRLYVGYVADARRIKRVQEIGADAEELLNALEASEDYEFAFTERKRGAAVEIVKAPKALPKLPR
jgi:hypothetical protein